MPQTALAAMLAAASMAGFPLFFGFIAKEQVYESVGTSTCIGLWPEIVVTAAVLASILQGAAALITGVSPFLGHDGRGPAMATRRRGCCGWVRSCLE